MATHGDKSDYNEQITKENMKLKGFMDNVGSIKENYGPSMSNKMVEVDKDKDKYVKASTDFFKNVQKNLLKKSTFKKHIKNQTR